MAYLLDTNCFLRLAEPDSLYRNTVLDAIRKLRLENESLHFTPQILAEFWNVCTRPATARGGLGLTVIQTERKVRLIEKHFQLLPDNLATFIRWRQIVLDLQVKGVQVHDSRIVASMVTYGIQNLVTFNEQDFRRYSMITVYGPGQI